MYSINTKWKEMQKQATGGPQEMLQASAGRNHLLAHNLHGNETSLLCQQASQDWFSLSNCRPIQPTPCQKIWCFCKKEIFMLALKVQLQQHFKDEMILIINGIKQHGVTAKQLVEHSINLIMFKGDDF
jgi:hypothetical protein